RRDEQSHNDNYRLFHAIGPDSTTVIGNVCAAAPRSIRGPRSTSLPTPPASLAPLTEAIVEAGRAVRRDARAHEARVLEQFDQRHAGDEPADVRPDGDAGRGVRPHR